jgi:hypothetical protein
VVRVVNVKTEAFESLMSIMLKCWFEGAPCGRINQCMVELTRGGTCTGKGAGSRETTWQVPSECGEAISRFRARPAAFVPHDGETGRVSKGKTVATPSAPGLAAFDNARA